MALSFCLCAVLVADVGQPAPLVQNPSVMTATFVRPVPGLGERLVRRFVVRTVADADVELELGPTAIVLRNGQIARLNALKPGDKLVMYLVDPHTQRVARMEAAGP